MRRAPSFAVVLLFAVLSATAGGEACPGPLPAPEVNIAMQYYIDVDVCGGTLCTAAGWVYEESNGIANLQRRDPVQDDTCGLYEPDFLIFGLAAPGLLEG